MLLPLSLMEPLRKRLFPLLFPLSVLLFPLMEHLRKRPLFEPRLLPPSEEACEATEEFEEGTTPAALAAPAMFLWLLIRRMPLLVPALEVADVNGGLPPPFTFTALLLLLLLVRLFCLLRPLFWLPEGSPTTDSALFLFSKEENNGIMRIVA